MQLTNFSDYALRVLMYAAAAEGRLVTIEETARTYGISRNHLMKVVNILTRGGFIKGVRGRTGGFTLGKPPEEINLGAVMRATETDLALVECFDARSRCVIAPCCRLPGVVNEALNAFVGVFDRYTLADILLPARVFETPPGPITAPRGPHLAAAAHDS